MAYCTFRLYYKIEILEKTSKGPNWETVQSVDLGRAFLPDFMDWYNDSFLQRCFCTYREDEVPKNVKVRQHFPSFDKELGLVFVLEYEADIGGIEHKHYEKLKKLIAKVAQDTVYAIVLLNAITESHICLELRKIIAGSLSMSILIICM